MTNSHLETIWELEDIALVGDTLERHIKLESPVAVLYHYDAKLKHRGQQNEELGNRARCRLKRHRALSPYSRVGAVATGGSASGKPSVRDSAQCRNGPHFLNGKEDVRLEQCPLTL